MKIIILTLFFGLSSFLASAQHKDTYTLDSFLTTNQALDNKVNHIFQSLNTDSKIAQLIMPASGRLGQHEDTIKALLTDQLIGGVLLLNGTKDQFTRWIAEFEAMNIQHKNLPFMYSADAEPSLVNRKIIGSTPVAKASAISNLSEVLNVAGVISDDLNDIGINYNFSPVVDMAKNKTVGYRGFGSNPENIIPFSNAFIKKTQSQNIIATAKHFPGHGLISGDTHKSLQVIDGELKELKNYPPLIDSGVLSIMVAHIAVKNNPEFSTNGAPATTSSVIVTDLLRDSLAFKGLIVTDAMNMGGVASYPNASVKAIDAGCDILLMPKNARKAHREIKSEYHKNTVFSSRVDLSVKRIIRMKICLGLL
ncbi:MAG: glycoside hydrolase family 3 N-terminal domain-containing protein [Crocinitomicaceae bacterium]|nr:glycoside hydrolase family 3 N-terminal domain-containing protein [Crocinitomicaceae bacterium]MDG1777410.1 glycoside hydrolase family 3 N-terminal domain-containing protein [Crocinitomicaceae bacterium]